jgi:hypothetical protein
MATVNEGRVDMWVCNMYEKSEFSKRFEEDFIRRFGQAPWAVKCDDKDWR